jgi:hypothetical protein
MGASACEQYAHIIKRYDWNTDIALAVCKAESEGDATAYNNEYHEDAGCHGSAGLFQIACVHGLTEEQEFDPHQNIAFAYSLYKKRGWQPWGVCHDGKVNCGLALATNN